jgi:hypothetical protein
MQILNCTINNSATSYFKIKNLMIQKGSVVTQWRPSYYDTDYVTAALQQDYAQSGGLVLASSIMLGTNNVINGQVVEQNTYSGMNGIYASEKSPAFWAGGKMVDAAETSTDAATFMVRMDGTAYAAKNTVRFNENQIEVGAQGDVWQTIMNSEGFAVNYNGYDRVAMKNTQVSKSDFDSAVNANSYIDFDADNGTSYDVKMRRHLYSNGSCDITIVDTETYDSVIGDYTVATLAIATNAIRTATVAIKGLRLRIQNPMTNVNGTTGDVYPLNSSRLRVRLKVTQGSATLLTQTVDYSEWNTNYLEWNIPDAKFACANDTDTVSMSITFISNGISSGASVTTSTVSLGISGKVYVTQKGSNQMLFGNNGTLQSWTKDSITSAAAQNATLWAVRVGNYGLRITSDNGFEVTQDGGSTWKAVDLSKILS